MSQTMTFEQLLDRDGHLAYTNKGVSMMPLLRQDKDVMIIQRKESARCKKLDAVLFKRPASGAYVLHRILRVNNDNTYWIIGDNCLTGETVTEANVLGILTAVVRDGKTIPVTSLPYRLYVNTWCRFYHIRIALLRARHFAERCLRRLGVRK